MSSSVLPSSGSGGSTQVYTASVLNPDINGVPQSPPQNISEGAWAYDQNNNMFFWDVSNQAWYQISAGTSYTNSVVSGWLPNQIGNNTPLSSIPGVTATQTQYLPLTAYTVSVTNPSSTRKCYVNYFFSGIDLMVTLDKDQDVISPFFQYSFWYEFNINGGGWVTIDSPSYGADMYVGRSSNRTGRNVMNATAHGYNLAYVLNAGQSHNIQIRKTIYYDVGGYGVSSKNLVLTDSGATNYSVTMLQV